MNNARLRFSGMLSMTEGKETELEGFGVKF